MFQVDFLENTGKHPKISSLGMFTRLTGLNMYVFEGYSIKQIISIGLMYTNRVMYHVYWKIFNAAMSTNIKLYSINTLTKEEYEGNMYPLESSYTYTDKEFVCFQ